MLSHTVFFCRSPSVLKRSGQTSFGPGRPVTWPVGRVKIRPGQVRPTSGQVTGQGYAITFVTCDDLGRPGPT